MDASPSKRKRKKKCLPCLFLLLILLWQADAISDKTLEGQYNSSQSVSCSENEYENDNGVCCDKCPPGFKLKKKCTGKGLRSQCEKCSSGTYQENTNYFENCFRCDKCLKKNAVEITPCTHFKNRECGCKKGYYKKEISSSSWYCASCKKCGDGERQHPECAGKKDTVCICKDLYYRVDNKTCAPCTNCSPEFCSQCPGFIITKPTHKPEATLTGPYIILITITVLSMTVTVGFIGYIVLRKWIKLRCRGQSSTSWPESLEPQQHVGVQSLNFTDLPIKVDESPLFTSQCATTKKDLVLPDCIPREIKSHEFIYFLLDEVPISRFKELVRRLNISEQDIERAERDNRAFMDAQYQMLKLWSHSRHGGGINIFPQSLVHECICTLKDMNLHGCAENIENKYCTEAQTLTLHI
ncbi:tumor necrosis factor receptor superfamily member 1A [Electrophorus electricus]|uniref:Tumor necrosis factor receptor superfamily, member 1a n=1 Tax=Electrophorus electricus TaxID=8005 RepID=A0A4W4H876_ELEEL|nr:tumor necrosis factor receptor superfamily member 1A [Electrophorus electricus]